MKLKFC